MTMGGNNLKYTITGSELPPLESTCMKGLLQVEILVACCAHWEIGEDDFDDHSEAKMGGEPRPTGRANFFDTRKILMGTP